MELSQESSDDDLYLFVVDDDVFLSAFAQQHSIVVQAAERSDDARLRGSTQGRLINKYRGRVQGYKRLIKDYFVGKPTYDAVDFRHQFRMSRPLFSALWIRGCSWSTATLRRSQMRQARWASRFCRTASQQCVSCSTASRQFRWVSPFTWRSVLVENACVALSQQFCKHLTSVISASRMRKTCNVY
uniref:Uncharacterized protein n=1 Tax=Hyaloperonospora arabidopsidis (strain Emoy2) TaxID=559515 RepID=M4BF51_HYAAE